MSDEGGGYRPLGSRRERYGIWDENLAQQKGEKKREVTSIKSTGIKRPKKT